MIFVSDISSRKIAPGQTISVFGGFFDTKVGISFGGKSAEIVECEEDILSAVAPYETGKYDVIVTYNGSVVKTFTGVSVVSLADTPTRNPAKEYTAADFDQYIRSLFPRGIALAMDRESNLSKMISSFAFAFRYVWSVIRSMMAAVDPTHTSNFDEWEEELSLPITGIESQTPDERRAEIYRSECTDGASTKSYIKKILFLMGIDADVFEYTKDPDKFSGQNFGNDDPRFYYKILFHLHPEDFNYFRAGSAAGDYLVDFEQRVEESVFNSTKQSHLKIVYGYDDGITEGHLLTDDGKCLTDDDGNRLIYTTKRW